MANTISHNISVYRINANTGVLTSVGAVALGPDPIRELCIDPSGKFAYVVNVANFSNNLLGLHHQRYDRDVVASYGKFS